MIHRSEYSDKQIWTGLLFIGVSAAFWFAVFWAFLIRLNNPVLFTLLLVAGLVWSAFFGFVTLFLPKRILFFVYGVVGIVIGVLFGLVDLNIIGIALFVGAMFVAYWRMKRAKKFAGGFRTVFFSRRMLPIFFTGLAILLAFFYMNYVLVDYVDNPRVSPKVWHIMFQPVEGGLQVIVPGYQEGMTIEEFQKVFVSGFMAQFLPEGAEVPQDEEAVQFVDDATGQKTLEQFTLEWLNQTIATIAGPYRDIMPALFVVGLFFAFRFLLWPLMWGVIGILWLAIKALMLYNILEEREVTTVHKVPVLE